VIATGQTFVLSHSHVPQSLDKKVLSNSHVFLPPLLTGLGSLTVLVEGKQREGGKRGVLKRLTRVLKRLTVLSCTCLQRWQILSPSRSHAYHRRRIILVLEKGKQSIYVYRKRWFLPPSAAQGCLKERGRGRQGEGWTSSCGFRCWSGRVCTQTVQCRLATFRRHTCKKRRRMRRMRRRRSRTRGGRKMRGGGVRTLPASQAAYHTHAMHPVAVL